MTVRCGLMSARIRSSAEDGSGCFELLELPSDTLTSVLQKLTYEDLVRVGTTCRTLRQLVDDDMMWIGFCKQWERQLDITTWHPRMKSAKSLFRLLRSFDKLVGSWQAKQQGPQGGLLYITWGDVSLEALRVLPLAAGNLKFVPLFQVVGMLDGTSRVELLTMRGLGNHWEVWLPGAVVWSPTTANEFHLERFERGHEHHRPAAAENKNDVTRRLQGDDSEREVDGVNGAVIWPGGNIMGMMIVDEQQNYMMRLLQMQQRLTVQNLALRSEPAINSRSLPSHSMSEYGQQLPTRRRRTLQYLLGLDHFRTHPSADAGGTSDCSQQGAQVCRSAYAKLSGIDAQPGQELRGLWSAVYGPHGLEIVTVSYTKDNIVATKILGDPNVPAGEVTFRAMLSTETSEVPLALQVVLASLTTGTHDMNQLEKVYQGFGHIANHNFSNPRWVPGHLLVDCTGRMSFLWEDSIVIHFRRLDLPSLYTAQRRAYASFQAKEEHQVVS
ncbi:unnamed protein product [Sphagnum troendelagicum]|uniref:F-box domain-containing protein n=1 Tax=Sphagnum troendelagicum TaxID=128251 RepID=A0ABP0V0W3_9BRYO